MAASAAQGLVWFGSLRGRSLSALDSWQLYLNSAERINAALAPTLGRGFGPNHRVIPRDLHRRTRNSIAGLSHRRTPLREAGDHPIARGSPGPVSMTLPAGEMGLDDRSEERR